MFFLSSQYLIFFFFKWQRILWTEKPGGLQSIGHKVLDMAEWLDTHTHTHTHTLYYYPNNNNTIRLNWLIFFFSWEVLPKTMNISKRNQGLVSNRAQTTLNRFKLSSVQLYTCSVAVHGITKSRTQLGDWTKTIIYQVIKHLHIWSPKHCNILRIHE